MSHRPLLILDLDETLVHATERALDRPGDHQVGPYAVYLRPGLREFLADMRSHYDLAVWTSSSPLYAAEVTGLIFPELDMLRFVWASTRCTLRRDLKSDQWVHRKHLAKVKRQGYDLDRVLVVDESPEKHERNYGNLVQVAPFTGDPRDDVLGVLAEYLAHLASESNLRSIEKRKWRSRWERRRAIGA